MIYNEIKPHAALTEYIDAFWTVNGVGEQLRKESILPDGCVDLIVNLGADCQTDNGSFTMQSGKCYLVGTMTTCKVVPLTSMNRLVGIRFKPGAFSSFYKYDSLAEVTDRTVAFEHSFSRHIYKPQQQLILYFNEYFLNRITRCKHNLSGVVADIQAANGQICIEALARQHCTTVRQLQRSFKKHIGISPKEFADIVRFRFAFSKIKNNEQRCSLLAIAYDTGYYDHAHLSNAIKRFTGFAPSQL